MRRTTPRLAMHTKKGRGRCRSFETKTKQMLDETEEEVPLKERAEGGKDIERGDKGDTGRN